MSCNMDNARAFSKFGRSSSVVQETLVNAIVDNTLNESHILELASVLAVLTAFCAENHSEFISTRNKAIHHLLKIDAVGNPATVQELADLEKN